MFYMNFFADLKSRLLMAVLVCVAACMTVVSCYDDSDLRDKIEMIVDRLFDLEQRLDSELSALKAMMEGKLLISSVSTDVATGVTTLVLSDGKELKLYPEADMSAFLTYYVNSAGVKHWAYINEKGKVTPFYDKDGGLIPIESSFPSVELNEDGEAVLVLGDQEYPLSGNSVFSDYELITDELTGEVYAVTFTFGEDMTFTVSVDGANGLYFVQASGGWSTTIIRNYYVANGLTERVQVDARGVVDYVLQVPDGWRVKETEDIYGGEKVMYFNITAPTKELVASGVAVAEGELKVMAVLQGGKATVSKLYLSSHPFHEFEVSLGKADIRMYNGLQKFVYGVSAKADYDEASILEVAETLLDAYTYPAGYGLSDIDLKGKPVAEILGAEPVVGEEYVLWALPVLYDMNAEENPYYLKEGTFETLEFKYNSVEFAVSSPSFRDAVLSMDLKGVDAYYTELLPEAEYDLEDVLYGLNNQFYDPVIEPMTYNGSVFEFAHLEATPATEYVAWIAVAQEGKTYAETDLVICYFATLDLVAGGSVSVVAGKQSATPTEVTVPLTAEGAESIYYTFVRPSVVEGFADEAAKANYLFNNGILVLGTSVDANSGAVISDLKPENDVVLLAVATDSEGKYGAVLTLDCKTAPIEYNDLKVNLELTRNDPNNVVVAISCEGGEADGYLYWVGKTSENTWKSSMYLGGSAETAQAYMYLNPDNTRFKTVAEKYPVTDGTITMTDLSLKTDYVVVAMARDKEGGYSKAEALIFTTRSLALGTIVESTDDKWAAAKPTIEWLDDKFFAGSGQLGGQYGFTVTVPQGFTAYVLAGTDSYLNQGNDDLVMSVEDKIIKIIEYVDKPRDWHLTVSDDWIWPHIGYEHYHSEHGAPFWGNSVIWADSEYHKSVCDCPGTTVKKMEINGYMVNVKYVVNINDGKPLEFRQPQAVGSTEKVVDKVFVVCQDKQGNCYENFVFDVPVEKFQNAGSRDE